jgi:tetratricopeptide (TPR) repeat protein
VTVLQRLRYLQGRSCAGLALLCGREAATRAAFDRLIEGWPQQAYAYASRAHLNAREGRYGPALADGAQVLALRPDDARAWFNQAYVLEAAGQPAQAVEHFERALALAPGLDLAWYGLGLACIQLQQWDKAVSALQRNTQLQPMSPFGWYQLARLQWERGEHEAARRIARHLRGFEPKVAAQLVRETGCEVPGHG